MKRRPRIESKSGRLWCLSLGAICAALLVGCTASTTADDPSTTTTTAAFTHAQVLGWVTPTLDNGMSLVGSAPPGSTGEQLFAASRPLGAATYESIRELAQVTWDGRLQKDENALVKALHRLEVLTASQPGPTYGGALQSDILGATRALTSLTAAVRG